MVSLLLGKRNAVRANPGRRLAFPVMGLGVAVGECDGRSGGGGWGESLGVLRGSLRVDQILGLGGEPPIKIFSEELGQRRVEIGRADAAVDDPEPVKDGLVELPFHGRGCREVKVVAVLAEREEPVKDTVQVSPLTFTRGERLAGPGQRPVDSILFLFEELLGYRAVVVGPHARAAFVFEIGDGLLLAGGLFGPVVGEGLRAGEHEFPDASLLPGSDLDTAPPVLHEFLHGADEDVGLSAFSALAAEAVEIWVDPTVSAGGVRDTEA
ncbi:hypothetical protein AB1484_03450 [Parafrankia sp. FMc6]|uniref:hypothetical protein n=1 Tax=Parafrankia soli TaxID=2599596 RepID=UPI0034D4E48E